MKVLTHIGLLEIATLEKRKSTLTWRFWVCGESIGWVTGVTVFRDRLQDFFQSID